MGPARLLPELPLVAAMRPGPEAGAGGEREHLPGLAAARLLRGVDVSRLLHPARLFP